MRYVIEGLVVLTFAIGPILPVLLYAGLGLSPGPSQDNSLQVVPWLILFTVPAAVVYLWFRLLWVLGTVLWKNYWK